METIEEVVSKNLCTGCGTCVAACPVNAISYKLDKKTGKYKFVVDHDKCINCGLCLKVCPGWKIKTEKKNFRKSGKYSLRKNQGKYLI